MKTKFYFLSAFATMLALVACNKEPKAPDNPTYNPDDNTVLTKLVLNVSSASASGTKQTASAVQAGGMDFRGMQDVHLLTYSLDKDDIGPAGDYFLFHLDDHTATKDFDLGDMMLPGDATTTSGIRILQLALPLETNTVLLYGRATRTGIDTDEKLGFVKAEGEATSKTLDNVTFSLKNRMNGRDAEFELFGDLMSRILTGIMNTGLEIQTANRGYKVSDPDHPVDGRYSFWWPSDTLKSGEAIPHKAIKDTTITSHTDPSKTWNVKKDEHFPNGCEYYDEATGITYTMNWGSVTWKEYGDKYDDPDQVLAPLAEVMGEAYSNIMTLGEKTIKGDVLRELRSASSGSVLRLTEDLFGILNRVVIAIPTTADERIAQLLGQEIMRRASNFYVADHSTGKVSYQTFETIMGGVDALIPDRSRTYYIGGTAKIDDTFFYRESVNAKTTTTVTQVGFPQNLGLPLGAAIMDFFTPPGLGYPIVRYLTAVPAYGVGGGSFPVANYRYPAELMYYTNSNIRTSNVSKQNDDFPQYTEYWWNSAYWTGWTGGNTIQSSTQSVGVAKTINYGTALLATRVGYSGPIIYDNNKGLHPSEANNSIDVSQFSDQFEITGIMIGGVCDTVSWNFLPKNNSFNKMIYDDLSFDGDKDHPGSVTIPKYVSSATERLSKEMYTLTFDNYDSSKDPDKQNIVYIALELKNKTGQDLWGELNVIRRDGTFYLVGALDPTKEAAVAKFKNKETGKIDLSRKDFNYPPFDEKGNTINAPRVFMQDYVTTVTMNFTPESLSHAYVTMPDLRAGQVSLGLSVDVKWESGFVFDVNLGGATN